MVFVTPFIWVMKAFSMKDRVYEPGLSFKKGGTGHGDQRIADGCNG